MAKLACVTAEIQEVRTENKLRREKIDALLRRLFGAQSEKLDAAQLLLMLQGFDERPKSPEPVVAEHGSVLLDIAYQSKFLQKFCKEMQIKTVLEFGPGASTLAFLNAGCTVVSIEENWKWF